MNAPTDDVFERTESNVRTYSRSFPAVFDRAKGALLYDEDGRVAGLARPPVDHRHSRAKHALASSRGIDAFSVENFPMTPVPVTSTLSAWMPSG
jgi:4-aminobutyrate aminotransferase-like enzyme